MGLRPGRRRPGSTRSPCQGKEHAVSRTKNPFVLDFIKKLMKESGEAIPDDPGHRRYEELYALFESLLGKNVLSAVPQNKQAEYMAFVKKNPSPSMESVGEILGGCIESPETILKKTMNDFKELYLRNRAKEK
jgi:hypothetical protein